MAEKVQIKMLGGFHVFVDGEVRDDKIGKTRKGSLLLQYLILQRGKSVPCIELYEALWPNDESSNPENALKTLVSRTRTLLAGISKNMARCIGTNRGAYRFNPVEGCEVDIYEFERLCEELSGVTQLSKEARAKFTEVLTLYTGDLLPYGAGETWVVPRSVDLHNRYMKIVFQYISLLKAV
jgi:DNA-binding SARP family transcriptional activator